uniref:Gp99.1 n=1 Tax=Caviid herpesvirus 2 str. CIDMTR TaxID=1415526 RepID=U6H6F6_9BETA|nr:gp99.1 [Caviid herpesvirus 2 str. CIDMTR]
MCHGWFLASAVRRPPARLSPSPSRRVPRARKSLAGGVIGPSSLVYVQLGRERLDLRWVRKGFVAGSVPQDEETDDATQGQRQPAQEHEADEHVHGRLVLVVGDGLVLDDGVQGSAHPAEGAEVVAELDLHVSDENGLQDYQVDAGQEGKDDDGGEHHVAGPDQEAVAESQAERHGQDHGGEPHGHLKEVHDGRLELDRAPQLGV